MRKPFIAGNWKMNTTRKEAVSLIEEMLPRLNEYQNVDIAVCPPFVYLEAVHSVLKGSSIMLGAQNMYFEEKGAYTGEVSPVMLADFCSMVILGHSERRKYFNETGEMISRKVDSAVKHGLKPVLCVGENLEQYESGQTEKVVTEMLRSSLDGVKDLSNVTIAYEPVWAIGTGKAATAEIAQNTSKLIRTELSGLFGGSAAEIVRILYGGSVKSDNIADFVKQPDCDGALVGGASLKADSFKKLFLYDK